MPVNDIAALKRPPRQPNVVAVFFEAIQGEGGVNPTWTTCSQLRALCATSATGC